MRTLSLILVILTLGVSHLAAQTPSSDAVLAPVKEKAAAEKKAIFLHFGASWCIWCKRLDAYLERPDVKPTFEKYFVPVKLVVEEKAKDRALENPGADKLLENIGGPGGLPFFAFLRADGSLIVNSKLNAGNIGFPSQPEEIDWFAHMMKEAAPRMPLADLEALLTALRKAQPTRTSAPAQRS